MPATIDAICDRLAQYLQSQNLPATPATPVPPKPSTLYHPPLHSPHLPPPLNEPFPILRYSSPDPDADAESYTPGFPPPPNLMEHHSLYYRIPDSCPCCGCTCRYTARSSNHAYAGTPPTMFTSAAGCSLSSLELKTLRKQVGSRMNQLEKSVRLAEAMLGGRG